VKICADSDCERLRVELEGHGAIVQVGLKGMQFFFSNLKRQVVPSRGHGVRCEKSSRGMSVYVLTKRSRMCEKGSRLRINVLSDEKGGGSGKGTVMIVSPMCRFVS